MVKNTFPPIASCKTIASTWKRLQDIFEIDFEAYMSKGESYEVHPYFEEFRVHFYVQYFEDTYKVLGDCCVDRGLKD